MIIEGDDVHGDGVNVAARLESLAEPGGICLSRAARDQIRDKLGHSLDDLGEVEVKNLARPVRVFRIIDEHGNANGMHGTVRKRRVRLKLVMLTIGLAAIAIIAGIALWKPLVETVDKVADASQQEPMSDQPSVVVLPFQSDGSDPEEVALAAAITEDITNNLARISKLVVISQSSAAAYEGKSATAQEIAGELGGHPSSKAASAGLKSRCACRCN